MTRYLNDIIHCMENIKLSIQPYKGTTDTYPQQAREREFLFQTWKNVAKEFGYEEYDTPIIEEAQLYRVKSGEELANKQLFNFLDKGGREIALRPEMTPSLARIIAAKKNQLTLPIRWFNIGRFYRYEKPQKGRTREFFQLNIDIFGIDTIDAELEIIMFVMRVMESLSAPKDTYELRINNRYLLEYLFNDILNIDTDIKEKLARAIDNYLKMEKVEFKEYLSKIGLTSEQIEKVEDFLSWDLQDLEKIVDKSRGAKELLDLFRRIDSLKISNVSFCPYIMRGLAYYTGCVIEMFDIGSQENPRALFGGGRYDDLLEIFGQEKLPAFGLGWGDVTTLDYLKTYNLLPTFKTDTQLYISLLDEKLKDTSIQLAQYFRNNGIKTEVQLTNTKLGKQLEYADKKGFPWVIILGEKELKKGVVQLKNMRTKESLEIKKEDVIYKIKQ